MLIVHEGQKVGERSVARRKESDTCEIEDGRKSGRRCFRREQDFSVSFR